MKLSTTSSATSKTTGSATKYNIACVLIYALTYVLTTGSAQAQWLMSLDLGGSNNKIHTADLNDQIGDGEIASIDTRDFSWQLGVGYQVDDKLSFRMSYLDLGQGSLVIEGDTVKPEELHQQVSEIMPILANGVTFGIQYQLFQHGPFSVDADFGGFRWKSKLTSQLGNETITHEQQDVDFYYGVKTYYHFTSAHDEQSLSENNWSVYLSYNAYRLPSDDVENWSLGLEYSF
jgi:hypothetical protein